VKALPLPKNGEKMYKAHRFIGVGESDLSQCLECGGLWVWDFADNSRRSLNGVLAGDCVTDIEHHYKGECPGENCSLNPGCNCLHCDS